MATVNVKVRCTLPDGTRIQHIRYGKKGWYVSSDGPNNGPMIWGPYPDYNAAKAFSQSKTFYYDVVDLIFEVMSD